jgi:hypothetical protein
VPGLTSPVLLALLAGLLALLLGGVIWGWPSLAGPGPRRFGLRVITLCAIQVTALALTFVAVNRANDFFSSWSDLLGRYSGGGRLLALPGGTAPSLTSVSVLSASPVSAPGDSGPGGVLQAVRIHGILSGLSLSGNVYLPPGYPRVAEAGSVTPSDIEHSGTKPSGAWRTARYPVIVAISASLNSGTSAYGARHLAVTVASSIAAHRLHPLIMVMLRPGPGSDLGCLNVPGGAQAAMFFAQDLPAAIGARYLATSARAGWGLLADSSGGYCALQLALNHASAFAAAAVPPAGYQVPPGRTGWAGSPAFQAQNDLQWVLRHQPMQPISVLFIGPSQAGPYLSAARGPMRVASLPPGASATETLTHAVEWLGRALTPVEG